MRSACLLWPGSEAAGNGQFQESAPVYLHFDDNVSMYEQRVQQILAWLKLPVKEEAAAFHYGFIIPMWTTRGTHEFGPALLNW